MVLVVKDEKSKRDTVKYREQSKAIGVDKKRVRAVFNQVEVDDDVENDFAAIFGLCKSEKCATARKNTMVYKNEVFDRIKSLGKPFCEISSDQTYYRGKLREANTEDEKDDAIAMIPLKYLAISANKNLDDAFTALSK